MIVHKKVLALVIFCFLSLPLFAQIQINEIVASNENSFADEDGDYPDWIELYNPDESVVNLNGFGISDDTGNRFQYILPDLSIAPGSFIVVFASDKNKYVDSTNTIHLNFKLSADGESVYLTSADSVLQDSLVYPELRSDESYGRSSISETGYFIFTDPTPLAPNDTEGYLNRLENPLVTKAGGFYSSSVEVSLQNPDLADHTYYTTDGTDPTTNSSVFGSGSKTFNNTTTLKLRTIEEGKLPSDILVHTYFLNETHNLPVVSLVTNPDYFFDENEGIYVHFEEDIEVPAHIEFFEEDGSLAFQSHIGTKIYGAYSRRFDQKSLSIFFRGEYGLSELDYRLFEEKDIDQFQSFILRNAGNDFGGAHMRDAAMTTIVEDAVDIDYQAYKPAVLYINGEYWGIQNVREKISEHFIASNHDVDADNVDLIEATEEPEAKNGTTDLYLEFLKALEDADITNQAEYEEVIDHIDLENFIDYMAIQIFYANTDWPGTNVKLWRDRSPEGKWRWILYDTDHGYNLYSGDGDFDLDMFEHTMQTDPELLKYSNPLWATKPFRKLMDNEGFKTQFLLRLNDLMNTVFQTDKMIHIIDSLSAKIAPEIPAHEERWNLVSFWSGEGPFTAQVQDMKDFAQTRHPYMIQHMQQHFDLSDLSELTVDLNDSNFGKVLLNRSMLDTFPWSGNFFNDFTIPVTAVPKTGYIFTGWTGSVTSTDTTIAINPGASVVANFAPVTGTTSNVVINEIMYNAFDEQDPGDWVELYNNTPAAINLSGWILKDEDDGHIFTFPDGTELEADGYLVVADDLEAFNQYYTEITNLYGELGFGLAGGSDQVRLFDASGEMVDIVSYDDEAPWPSQADGTGYSLELSDPNINNNEGANWNASVIEFGTPGQVNSTLVSNEDHGEIPNTISLKQNYPNPFNPGTTINFTLPVRSFIKLSVYDMLGREVSVLESGLRSSGIHSVYWDASRHASGMYIYRLETTNKTFTKKMLLIK